ncbi:MAG: MFS transporter [Eubacteriales bacterium]
MKLKYKILLFLTSFSLGLILPVQSLLLMAHGCTLQTLGLALGAYAVAVIAAEVPTGVFADLYGRKAAFLTAILLSAASGVVLLVSSSFPAAMAALMLMGLGVAFASGSADALIIEKVQAQTKSKSLHQTVSTLRILEAAGLMVGAICGGFLPKTSGYSLHIGLRLALTAIVFLLALFVLSEPKKTTQHAPSVKSHLIAMRQILQTKNGIKTILFCIAAFGFMQFMLETYWQPQLTDLADAGAQALLGVLSAASFGMTAVGSFVVSRIQSKKTAVYWAGYLLLALIMSAFVILLSCQTTPGGFAVVYLAIYLALGMVTVFEQTLIHSKISDSVRASMLSLTSFTARGGGVISSLVGASLIVRIDIASLWRIGAYIAIFCFALSAVFHRYSKHQHALQQQ